MSIGLKGNASSFAGHDYSSNGMTAELNVGNYENEAGRISDVGKEHGAPCAEERDSEYDDGDLRSYSGGERAHYAGGNNTYEIVSAVGYLIGVDKEKFEKEYTPLALPVYEKLDRDKNARIIRHLCIIRTKIELNFRAISMEMRNGIHSIINMPDYVPAESINSLYADGVSFYKSSNKKLNQHVIEINKHISNRINNCKYLFGSWIKWEYIKNLFIMPNGLDEAGTAEAADIYYKNKMLYPYQMYINWIPQQEGNILANDKKFMLLLYKWNGDIFNDYSKVSDAGEYVKTNIHDFISQSNRLVLIVVC